MAVLSLILNYLISRIRSGMGKRLHDQGGLVKPMLFLGIMLSWAARIYHRSHGRGSGLWIDPISIRSIRRKNERILLNLIGLHQSFASFLLFSIEVLLTELDQLFQTRRAETTIVFQIFYISISHLCNPYRYQKV